jgi:predicted glutamine amidotransferase
MREKCGVFGVHGPGLEAARLVHTGLWTLQHRGQESSGISASDGKVIRTHKGAGLVAHVYDEVTLSRLPGHQAVGHNRYSTSGGAGAMHSQPVTGRENLVVLAHNGNLPAFAGLSLHLPGILRVGSDVSDLVRDVKFVQKTHNASRPGTAGFFVERYFHGFVEKRSQAQRSGAAAVTPSAIWFRAIPGSVGEWFLG